MTKLAAWSFDAQHGEDGAQPSQPQNLERSHIELEQHLEDWIANDVTLIGEGYTLVGRQVTIDDGRLDLLAIDAQDRWIVIEVKPGRLGSGALGQALNYAASLARINADELYEKLEDRLRKLSDAKTLLERVRQQLDGEAEEREIAVLLVGVGIHAGLERMNEFLARFGVPISVVSFEVFELEGGPRLLVREVIDEPVKPSAPKQRRTVEAIRVMASEAGVLEQFDRFVQMSKEAGLPVQPQAASVRIAPPQNRSRFLMYAGPRAGANGGELGIWVGPWHFAEWFQAINEEDAVAALGTYDDGGYLSGKQLDDRLDQIARFLKDNFPQPD
ncbi:MAG: endonuclease NucS [Chloroflexota bacterium]|nr:endonuclease NucS [Chloroflexota bacterium]